MKPSYFLSSESAVACLLQKLKIDVTAIQLPHATNASDGERILPALARHGVYGRIARIEAQNLRGITTPSLISIKDNRWLLVVSMGWRRCVVEDGAQLRYTLSFDSLVKLFDGTVLDINPELPQGTTLWSRLARLIWHQRRILYPALALGLFAQSMTLLVPQLAGALVDRAFTDASLDLLFAIIGGMVFAALIQAWCAWLEGSIARHFQLNLDVILERALLAHILQLPFNYLEKKSLGRLMQGFQGIGTSRSLLTGDVFAAALGSVSAIVVLLMMMRIMPLATLIVAAVSICAMSLSIGIGLKQTKLQQHVVDASVREREYAAEIFTHIATLKAAGAEQYSVEHWQSLLRDARKLGLRGERLSLGTDVIDGALGQIQIQAIWIWGGYQVMHGGLQLGEVMAFALMSALFHASVSHIGKVIITLRAALPHLRETDDLLKQPSQRHVSPARVTQLPPGVRIRNLWFRYDLEGQQRAWVFTDFKLDLAPGEICVLDAPSGFGKTTLLKLIAGLYLPTKGTIAIAGRSPAEMREQLIYLPQFVQLFNASVLDNLRIFSGDTSRTKLLHAAELTGLHRLMLELPMGYDTLLSQGGKNISGGQRQLIALTAVLASSKPLLLLDEAAANLDAVQWSAIKSSPLFTGKTVLCVSHSVAQNTSVRL